MGMIDPRHLGTVVVLVQALACGGSTVDLQLTPQTVDFPSAAANTVEIMQLTISNPTPTPVTLTPSAITGPQASLFSIDQTSPSSVGPASSVQISVTYSPTAASTDDNAVFVLSASSGGSVTVPLHGSAH
jgi:P pilus assembly chaperone PapD